MKSIKKSGRGVTTMKNKEEYANNPTIIYCEVVPGYMIEVKGVTQNHVYFMAENRMHRAKLKYHDDGGSYFKWMNQRITID